MTRPITEAAGRDSYVVRDWSSGDQIGAVVEQGGRFIASRFGTPLGWFPSLADAADHIAAIDAHRLEARP
ncbi:hypothetical protein [Ferrovibrio sp.]|uniref:hypothetical protein n=1 Tax=Ferrovibrio sp. TaxID=1917215 RepID=UPI003D12997E